MKLIHLTYAIRDNTKSSLRESPDSYRDDRSNPLPEFVKGDRHSTCWRIAMTKNILVGTICLTAILFIPLLTHAQDVPTLDIEWKVASSFEAQTGMMHEEESTLITYTNQQIEWVSWDGVTQRTYNVNGVRGHWYNMDLPGSITYQVNTGEQHGSITIERTVDNMVARIMMIEDGEPVVYELTLSNAQKL